LASRAEERSKVADAPVRRAEGFAVASAPVAAGGFGRRANPIPSTTNGAVPLSVANDRAARAEESIELTFAAERAVESRGAGSGDAGHRDSELTHELIDWLQFELRRGREVQPEAMLCAFGALAGYAAQQAIREALVKTGQLTLDQAFAVIETRSGEVFFFGERLNAVIVAKDGARNSSINSGGNGVPGVSGHASIWKIVSEGGFDAGAINLPDVVDVIKHCAATVGRDEFGIPRVPDAHMPNILPREAVSRFWPAARRKLAGIDPMSWPLQLALAARSLIVSSKHAVRPDIAVQIVMEAAVPMSKIDPVSLPKE
jgi:hypothetical protein